MKLIFLGTGSAFTVGGNNYHSNALLQAPSGKHLLIDCGSDIRFSLFEQGFKYSDIQNVYISHLHADHVGGLEWLAFSTLFGEEKMLEKPNLYISESLVDDLWNKVLSGGLSSYKTSAQLSSFFNLHVIQKDKPFHWEGIQFDLVKTVHCKIDDCVTPSFGLMLKFKGKEIFITTDTQFMPEYLWNEYQKADLIFQDCEVSITRSGCHSHYTDLVELDPKIKEKMWLYHYQPIDLPNAKKDGFIGFVKKGQVFDISTL